MKCRRWPTTTVGGQPFALFLPFIRPKSAPSVSSAGVRSFSGILRSDWEGMVGRTWPRETVLCTGSDPSLARCRGFAGRVTVGGRTGVRSNQHRQGQVPLDEDAVPFTARMTVDVFVVNSPRRCRKVAPSLIDTPKMRKKLAGRTAAAIPTLVTDYSSSCSLGVRQRSGHLRDYVGINHGHVNDV